MKDLAKKPKPRPKNRGGAPKGNRSTLKTGRHTGAMRALRGEAWRIVCGARRALWEECVG
jgi:hypothetical protein